LSGPEGVKPPWKREKERIMIKRGFGGGGKKENNNFGISKGEKRKIK